MHLTTDINVVISTMQSGGVVVYPTETTYGIGCDATNAAAVARVFAVKHRPEGKGVTLLTASSDPWGDMVAQWRPELRMLAERFWPGALNVVLPMREDSLVVPQCCTGTTISLRQSSHPIASALANGLGAPLVSTSANISGEPERYNTQEIFDRFSQEALQPDLIFDAGTLPHRPPSTLITWDEATQRVIVLRQGEIIVS